MTSAESQRRAQCVIDTSDSPITFNAKCVLSRIAQDEIESPLHVTGRYNTRSSHWHQREHVALLAYALAKQLNDRVV